MKRNNYARVSEDSERQQPDTHSSGPSVSALSKFGDMVWDFSVEIRNPAYKKYTKVIRWDFDVGEGQRFGDPKFLSLVLGCKQLLYAMLWHPEPVGKSKRSNIVSTWLRLRHFAVFLARRPYPILRFKDVTPHAVDEYRKALDLPNEKGKKHSKRKLYQYYRAVQLLYIYRNKIDEPIQFDPFDRESPAKVLGLTRPAQSTTSCIPDEVLSKLIASALDYTNNYSDFILEAAATAQAVRQQHHGKDKRTITHHLTRQLTKISPPRVVNNKASFDIDVLSIRLLGKHLVQLRTACFILIAFLTGMRLSEILSIKAGCIETERTGDGEFIWIHSTLHKTLDGSEAVPSRWLCGPVAAKAVSVLERLTSEIRRSTGCPHLFVPVTKCGVSKWYGESVGVGTVTDKLKDYVKFLDLRDKKGRQFNLHTHMFRRTFARHVVRSDTTNLLALKNHFKHVSLAMTDYYIGVDEELQDLLNDEANRLSFESFDKALRSDRLGGARGKELVRQVNSAIEDGRVPPEFRGEAGAHLRRKMIAQWIAAGQQIYPCGAGNDCWFREGSALCTKGDRPVVEICNPVGCPNSVIRPEHEPHWHSIEARAEELLRLNPSGEPYKQRLHTIIRIAKKVRQDIA